VFLHNGGTSHRIWTAQIERFAISHTVVAFDFPGFGSSGPPHGEYTLDLCTDILERVVDEHGLEDVALIGNCMGSATALAYTARHPERVRGVFAVNVLTDRTVAPGILGPIARLSARSPAVRRAIVGLTHRMPMPAAMARLYVRTQIADHSQADPAVLEHLAERWREPGNAAALSSLRTDTFTPPKRGDDWPPVHIVWGARNRILPAHTAAGVCAATRADRHLVIQGTGHLPMVERPAEVTMAIAKLLAAAPARRLAGV
jgi:pimeloyl-ACP methyl ester carboxylesterase